MRGTFIGITVYTLKIRKSCQASGREPPDPAEATQGGQNKNDFHSF